MIKTDWLKLFFSMIVCVIVGSIGTIFTSPNIPTWYASLNKPFFNPPNWLFGPVWTLLFCLMGISIYLIWMNNDKKTILQRKIALILFVIQFVLNILWSFLFFGLKNPLFGFIGIIFLWIAIVNTMYFFYKVDKKAFYLLIPYLAWVSFATLLNFSIMILN